jgi:hypothetical protein
MDILKNKVNRDIFSRRGYIKFEII